MPQFKPSTSHCELLHSEKLVLLLRVTCWVWKTRSRVHYVTSQGHLLGLKNYVTYTLRHISGSPVGSEKLGHVYITSYISGSHVGPSYKLATAENKSSKSVIWRKFTHSMCILSIACSQKGADLLLFLARVTQIRREAAICRLRTSGPMTPDQLHRDVFFSRLHALVPCNIQHRRRVAC